MTQRSPVVLVTGTSSESVKPSPAPLRRRASRFSAPAATRNAPSRSLAWSCWLLDVTDLESVADAVATVIQRAGRIDVLVNNAGVGVFGAVEESSIGQAQELFETNFFGLVRLTREVLPYLRAQGSGRIINVGSVLGFLPAPYGAFYAASKHAVEGSRNPWITKPASTMCGCRSSTRLHQNLVRNQRDRRRFADRELRASSRTRQRRLGKAVACR